METETYGEENIKCPWCGSVETDSWEKRSDDGIETCECGKKYEWQRVIDVTYNTQRVALD